MPFELKNLIGKKKKCPKKIDNTQELPIDCDSQEVTQFDIQ
jgi:hypothetical protein